MLGWFAVMFTPFWSGVKDTEPTRIRIATIPASTRPMVRMSQCKKRDTKGREISKPYEPTPRWRMEFAAEACSLLACSGTVSAIMFRAVEKCGTGANSRDIAPTRNRSFTTSLLDAIAVRPMYASNVPSSPANAPHPNTNIALGGKPSEILVLSAITSSLRPIPMTRTRCVSPSHQGLRPEHERPT